MDAAKVVAAAIQLALGAVFLGAAVPKLRDLSGFARAVRRYEVLPDRAVTIVANVVPVAPVAEAAIAVSFLTGWLVRAAWVVAIVLLLGFAWAVVSNLTRGRIIPCACFGQAGEVISVWTAVRIVTLLVGVSVSAVLSQASEETWLLRDAVADPEELLFTIMAAAFFFSALALAMLASQITDLAKWTSGSSRRPRGIETPQTKGNG